MALERYLLFVLIVGLAAGGITWLVLYFGVRMKLIVEKSKKFHNDEEKKVARMIKEMNKK